MEQMIQYSFQNKVKIKDQLSGECVRVKEVA